MDSDSDNCLFSQSQPNNYVTDYSAHPVLASFVPTVDGLNCGRRVVCHRNELRIDGGRGPYYRRVTIDSLPDDALLEIFNFYMGKRDYGDEDAWHGLVHVCQRWRTVVFSSPRRLNLQLLCNYRRPVDEMLNIWPELPIIVQYFGNVDRMVEVPNNVIAALDLTDRVSRIKLWSILSSELDMFEAVMQVPFNALTELDLRWRWDESGDVEPVISDEFLGGSAPRLRDIWLEGIPFPALRRLLLSTTNLVFLCLEDIPHSGYISPEHMVACLSTLTRLKSLSLGFRSPLSRPPQANRDPQPQSRAVLPVLTSLHLCGVTEYLEDILARIDVPLLRDVEIAFFNQLVFDIVQLPKFLGRINGFAVHVSAHVFLHPNYINVILSMQPRTIDTTTFEFRVSCSKRDWQLSSLSQLCVSTLSTLSNLEHLNITWLTYSYSQLEQQDELDDIENIQWLELLQPFSTVKNLHLSKQAVARIAPALQELAREQVTEVLPTLQVLFLDELEPSGPIQEALREFVAVRQHSGCPVAIRRWEGRA